NSIWKRPVSTHSFSYESIWSNLALTSSIPQTSLNALFPRPSRHRTGLRLPTGDRVPRLLELAQQPGAGSVTLRRARPFDPDADQHHHESLSRSHHRTHRQRLYRGDARRQLPHTTRPVGKGLSQEASQIPLRLRSPAPADFLEPGGMGRRATTGDSVLQRPALQHAQSGRNLQRSFFRDRRKEGFRLDGYEVRFVLLTVSRRTLRLGGETPFPTTND